MKNSPLLQQDMLSQSCIRSLPCESLVTFSILDNLQRIYTCQSTYILNYIFFFTPIKISPVNVAWNVLYFKVGMLKIKIMKISLGGIWQLLALGSVGSNTIYVLFWATSSMLRKGSYLQIRVLSSQDQFLVEVCVENTFAVCFRSFHLRNEESIHKFLLAITSIDLVRKLKKSYSNKVECPEYIHTYSHFLIHPGLKLHVVLKT